MLGLISLTLFVVAAVLGFLINRMRKARMQRALGRKIENHDLTSINSWMAVAESEDRRRS